MTDLPIREPMALPEVGAMKRAGTKIVMVTAYDHPSARLASEAGIDLILVGDSAGNNVLGYDTTVPVSMDEAVMLTGAVARAKPRALVIGDMPFGSFQASDEEAVANAVRLVKAGADAVKLEGAGPMVARVSRDRRRGHPGHGPSRPDAAVRDHARRHEGPGRAPRPRRASCWPMRASSRARDRSRSCWSRCPARIAAHVTEALGIPTIGIGAGPGCDGQVLVWHDLLGLNDGPTPRFVKRYADLSGEIRRGLHAFAADVRSGAYPADEHVYKIPRRRAPRLRGRTRGLGALAHRRHAAARCGGPHAPLDRLGEHLHRRDAQSHEVAGRHCRPASGREREDRVTVEEGVDGHDRSRERVVSELGQAPALRTVEVRVGRDDRERRLLQVRRGRRRQASAGDGPAMTRPSRPTTLPSALQTAIAASTCPSASARPAMPTPPMRTPSGPESLATVAPVPAPTLPSIGSSPRSAASQAAAPSAAVGRTSARPMPRSIQDRGRHDRDRSALGREADAAFGQPGHHAIRGRQAERGPAGQADGVDRARRASRDAAGPSRAYPGRSRARRRRRRRRRPRARPCSR